MIDRLGDLKTRIQRWIKEKRSDGKPLFEFVDPPNSVVVRETKEAGEAHVEYQLPEETHCISWHLESTGYFLFLKGEKSADGAFFVCHQDGRIDVHIVECKKTMEAPKWRDAKLQLHDSLSKLLAIAGVLGVEINHVYLGAAFREDRVDVTESSEPRLGAVPFMDNEEASTVMNARAQELFEWRTSQVRLRGFAKPFPLTKIQLDPQTGRGTYLTPPNP